MARKRASLKDKGEEILGVKRGGQGAEILFGAGGGDEPQVSSRDSAVAATMPQEGEADLEREADLDSLLGAEAQAAGGEAALPELATTPASPTPPTESVISPPVVVRPSPAPPPAMLPEPVVPAVVTRPSPEPPPAVATVTPTYPVASQPQAAAPAMPPYTPKPPAQPALPSPAPAVTPPSTATGAPDLSVPRSLHYISMVGKDYDVLAEELSADAVAATLVGIPQGATLTPEQRAQQLRRPSVRKKLVDLDRAIAGQYDRILQQDVSVNKPITDWCQNMLAEARTIVLNLQVENLAKAEWDVEQVRARLDRADESQRQSRVMAWPIMVWGLAWFLIFVYLLFNPTFIMRALSIDTSSFSDAFLVPAIFLRALFFGGIGGVAAVFYHLFKYVRERSFDSQYALSYVGKPFMGMILGSMVYLMVFVVMKVLGFAPPGLKDSTTGSVTDVIYTALLFFVAMAAGFKENLAFNMLNRLIKTVLGDEQPPEQGSAPPAPVPGE
jgi:hypothetical protein